LERGGDAAHEFGKFCLSFLGVVGVLDVDEDFVAQPLRQVQITHSRISQIDFFLQSRHLLLQILRINRKKTKQHIIDNRAKYEQRPGKNHLSLRLRYDLTHTKRIKRRIQR